MEIEFRGQIRRHITSVASESSPKRWGLKRTGVVFNYHVTHNDKLFCTQANMKKKHTVGFQIKA